MRLIDGEELKTAFPPGETVRTESVMATIDHMPTIEPRQKGEWIDDGRDKVVRWYCSICGRWDRYVYNFCPNCGADMREEEQDE